jgi:hypothetical protein
VRSEKYFFFCFNEKESRECAKGEEKLLHSSEVSEHFVLGDY